jgi:hypothetical protein
MPPTPFSWSNCTTVNIFVLGATPKLLLVPGAQSGSVEDGKGHDVEILGF